MPKPQDPSLIDVILGRHLAAAYQKIFRLSDLAPLGHEAFVRGPKGRLEAPAALFAEAERLGLVMDLDLACLATCLAQSPDEGLLFANLRPATLLWLAARPEDLAGCLGAKPPASVVFELTELDRVDRVEEVARAAAALKSAGFRLALDDLARGYNRLELLTALAPDYIKLDEPFVAGCHLSREKRAAVKHLLGLAADLGARAIAEHIKKAEELACLKALGVEYGQGFYLARPERRERRGAQVDQDAPGAGRLPAAGGAARPLA